MSRTLGSKNKQTDVRPAAMQLEPEQRINILVGLLIELVLEEQCVRN